MTIMFLTFLLLTLIILAMSIGVIFANKPIKGSCGGLGSLGLKGDCPICGGGGKVADRLPEQAEPLFYNVGKKLS